MPRTALIVDDSASIREMVAFTLREAGFVVLEGIHGAALARADGSYDLAAAEALAAEAGVRPVATLPRFVW